MRRTLWSITLLLLLVGLGESGGPVFSHHELERLDPSLAAMIAWSATGADQPMPVIVELNGPTAFDLYRRSAPKLAERSVLADRARQTAFETVAAAQAPARRFIEASQVQIVSTYDSALNGFLVLATPAQVRELTRTPGLRRIYRAPEHYPLLKDAVPLVGGVQVLQELGYSGKDVTIAIIDQGIDYTHKSFGGGGTARDYADNNPNVVEPRSFPTAKVIGGYDFAGSDYGAGGMPRPDGDPLDEGDHGTHVAGIAAGMRGNAKVHHGVAPDAKLIALKVFGRGPGTNLSTDGIEWAIEANMGANVPGSCQMPGGKPCRVDVLNMSLGSPWANGVLEQTGAVERAVEAGIVLVAAAGNDDDVPFIHGAPAAAPMALAVANTFHGGLKSDVVEATYGGQTHSLEALEGGKDQTGQLRLGKPIADVGEVKAALADFGRGCNADQATAPDVSGKVALIERGTCPFSEKVANATAKGAVAALVYNNQPGILVMGPTAGYAADQIPAYFIRQQDGLALRDQLVGGVRIRMAQALNGTFVRSYLADAIGLGSSRGPARSGAFKPNISAPGTEIFAPQRASGDGGVAFTGTSMAAPMVAGGAALLIERLRAEGLAPKDAPLTDPTKLRAADVAAMLMNYAMARVYESDNRVPDYVPLARQGSGRMDLVATTRGLMLARAGHIAELDFGIRALTSDYSAELPVTIRNLGRQTGRYELRTEFHTPSDADAGVNYEVTPSTLVLEPGQEAEVTVAVRADPSHLRPFAAYGGANVFQSPAVSEAEIDGFLVVSRTADGGQPDTLHVPIYFLPRRAAAVAATANPVRVSPAAGQGELWFANSAPGDGVAEVFAHVGSDATGEVHPRIDIDEVGARLTRDSQGRTILSIAVHTRAARRTPVDSDVYALFDTNDDGRYDYAAHLAYVNGQVVTVVQRVTRQAPLGFSNQAAADFAADVNIDSRSVILHILADRLGLTPGAPVQLQLGIFQGTGYADVVGGVDAPYLDAAPDDAVELGPQGTVAAGPGRLRFASDELGYTLDRWTMAVASQSLAAASLRRVGTQSLAGRRLMAVYPWNEPTDGDMELLSILEAEAPTQTPIPFPTDRPEPERNSWLYLPAALCEAEIGPAAH